MIRQDYLLACNDLSVGRAATYYIEHGGLAVFPVRNFEKRPATRHGHKDALSLLGVQRRAGDGDVVSVLHDISAWYDSGEDPRYDSIGFNVGLACGAEIPSDRPVDVLDVDVKDGKPGMRALKTLKDAGLLDGHVARASTPSGGLHLFFPSAGARSGAAPSVGLDYKAAGGYVVLAPSRVALTGLKNAEDAPGRTSDAEQRTSLTYEELEAETIGRYRWLWSRDYAAGAPFDWAAAKSTLGVSQRVRDWSDYEPFDSVIPLEIGLSSQRGGNRNSYLYWAARRAAESDLDPWDLLDVAVRTGLTLTETRATIRSAIKAHQDDRSQKAGRRA